MSPRILPPDVYDALELSALAFDGIGSVFSFDARGERPCNIIGHIFEIAGPVEGVEFLFQHREVRGAILTAFEQPTLGALAQYADRAAFTHHERKSGTRLPWAEYCRRLNIVRGETPSAGDAVST